MAGKTEDTQAVNGLSLSLLLFSFPFTFKPVISLDALARDAGEMQHPSYHYLLLCQEGLFSLFILFLLV